MSIRAGKAFNARLPEPMHSALKRLAFQEAKKQGGQTNINKELVRFLYIALAAEFSEGERDEVERFIRAL